MGCVDFEAARFNLIEQGLNQAVVEWLDGMASQADQMMMRDRIDQLVYQPITQIADRDRAGIGQRFQAAINGGQAQIGYFGF